MKINTAVSWKQPARPDKKNKQLRHYITNIRQQQQQQKYFRLKNIKKWSTKRTLTVK